MTSWMTYKGLELPDSPVGEAGDKLADDLKLLADGMGDFLPMAGDSYVIAERGADDIENAANLRAAYAAATALTPGGNALSATNRATVFVLPGRYDFGTGDGSNHGLVLDEEFVDLVGLSSVAEDNVLTSQIATASRGTVEQTADNVRIANLTLDIASASAVGSGSTKPAAYFPDSALTNAKIMNVAFSTANGNSYAARQGITYSGTYISCTSAATMFGNNSTTASGTFIDCNCAGSGSFGGNGGGTASGNFTNCVGGGNSFGGNGGTASGTFINCVGGDDSWGGDGGIASGTFTNCICTGDGFGSQSGTASGIFTDCVANGSSFGGNGGTASGTFTRCSCPGSEAFAGDAGTASGTFIDCQFSGSSWDGTFTGLMDGCRWEVTGTNKTALKVGSGARVYNCTLIGTGTGKSIDAASAINAKIAHCRMNKGIGTNVTNDIGTPYNVDDPDIS
jgi:hypothetical protein